MAIGLDVESGIVANLQNSEKGNYSPITSVRQVGDTLYFGSLTERSIGKIKLNP